LTGVNASNGGRLPDVARALHRMPAPCAIPRAAPRGFARRRGDGSALGDLAALHARRSAVRRRRSAILHFRGGRQKKQLIQVNCLGNLFGADA
jgi:hypothetical protein